MTELFLGYVILSESFRTQERSALPKTRVSLGHADEASGAVYLSLLERARG